MINPVSKGMGVGGDIRTDRVGGVGGCGAVGLLRGLRSLYVTWNWQKELCLLWSRWCLMKFCWLQELSVISFKPFFDSCVSGCCMF